MGTFRGWLTIDAGAFVTATVGISLPVAYLGGVCLDLPSGSASALIQGSQTISGRGAPLSRAGCPSSERTHMHRLLPSLFTAAFALAFFGMVQANQTALAQGPDKPAARPAPPAARAAPRAGPAARPAQPAARAAPRAAPAAPRQVARPPAPRPAARAPATTPDSRSSTARSTSAGRRTPSRSPPSPSSTRVGRRCWRSRAT